MNFISISLRMRATGGLLACVACMACAPRSSAGGGDDDDDDTSSSEDETDDGASSGGSDDSGSTGSPSECPDNPDFRCEQAFSCEEDWIGCGPLEAFDGAGCMRLLCEDDGDCEVGERCFRPQDYGGCVSSGPSCEMYEGECHCGGDDDCGGAYCVSEADYPGRCDQFTTQTSCEGAFPAPYLAFGSIQTDCRWLEDTMTVDLEGDRCTLVDAQPRCVAVTTDIAVDCALPTFCEAGIPGVVLMQGGAGEVSLSRLEDCAAMGNAQVRRCEEDGTGFSDPACACACELGLGEAP